MTLDYKGGVSFLRPGSSGFYTNQTIALCTCGKKFYGGRSSTVCTCGNYDFKQINRPSKSIKTVVGGMFNCLEKTHNSFKLEKTELVAHITIPESGYPSDNRGNPLPDAYSLEFTTGKKYRLEYSLRGNVFDVYKDDVLLESGEKTEDLFFRGMITQNELISIVSTPQNKELYEFSYLKLGKKRHEKTYKWSRALKRLFDYPEMELLSNCGLAKHCDFIHSNRSNIITKNPDGTLLKPHDIFGVPKYMMEYIREMDALDYYSLKSIRSMDEKLTSNNFKSIMQIFKEESSLSTLLRNEDYINTLYKDYGYKDVKRLALYVTREVKLQQGITSPRDALVYLKDYNRMSKAIGTDIEKYPKSLKKEHDIASLNYNVNRDERKNREFQAIVNEEGYNTLSYKDNSKGNEYEIVIPQTSQEIISEGSSLSHCVASYVDDVIVKRCKIVFLRYKDKLDKPLITIEIRDNNIRQVRGQSNRSATAPEKAFVAKWAEKRKLKYDVNNY